MDQIREWLFIGKFRETQDELFLQKQGVGAVLQLAEPVGYKNITELYLPVEDAETLPGDLLEGGINFIVENKAMNISTLVACGAGISRSGSFALAAIKVLEETNLLSAYQIVKNAHPETFPHPLLWTSLCEYFEEDVPFSAVLKAFRK